MNCIIETTTGSIPTVTHTRFQTKSCNPCQILYAVVKSSGKGCAQMVRNSSIVPLRNYSLFSKNILDKKHTFLEVQPVRNVQVNSLNPTTKIEMNHVTKMIELIHFVKTKLGTIIKMIFDIFRSVIGLHCLRQGTSCALEHNQRP